MAPPLDANKPSEAPAPASPFELEDQAPAPAAPSAAATTPAPATAAPAAAVAPQAAVASRSTPEENAAFEYKFWHRLHLTLGGGGSFGTRVYGEPEPFNLAAQKLKGPMIFFQPTFTVYAHNPREEKPNGDFEVRIGADIKNHFLANSAGQSTPDSSVNALSVGALAEASYYLSRMFGIGANVNFGRMGLSSTNADVGAPFSATLDWGSEGGFNLGAQLFLSLWDGNLRIAGQYDTMLGAFDLDAGPGNPPLRTAMDPIVGFGVGIDPIGIIRSVSEDKPAKGAKK